MRQAAQPSTDEAVVIGRALFGGTLIDAWATHKSFRPKNVSDEDGTDFHV